MAAERKQAFISYTSDLKVECDAVFEVCNRMRITPFDYKQVGANSEPPREYLDQKLQTSEIYLGILGGKHGSTYPPPKDRSIVQFEFETFRSHGGLRLTAVFPKVLPPEQIEPLQQVFRARATAFDTGVWAGDFDSLDTLRSRVRDAITDWLLETQEPIIKAEHEDLRKTLRKITLLAGIVCGFAVVIAVVYMALNPGVPSSTVAATIACLSALIVIGMLFVQFLTR